jgi:hypothetical protein
MRAFWVLASLQLSSSFLISPLAPFTARSSLDLHLKIAAPPFLRCRSPARLVMEATVEAGVSTKAGPEAGKCAIPPPKTLRNVYFGIRHGQVGAYPSVAVCVE